jgi:hypothetical protein
VTPVTERAVSSASVWVLGESTEPLIVTTPSVAETSIANGCRRGLSRKWLRTLLASTQSRNTSVVVRPAGDPQDKIAQQSTNAAVRPQAAVWNLRFGFIFIPAANARLEAVNKPQNVRKNQIQRNDMAIAFR